MHKVSDLGVSVPEVRTDLVNFASILFYLLKPLQMFQVSPGHVLNAVLFLCKVLYYMFRKALFLVLRM